MQNMQVTLGAILDVLDKLATEFIEGLINNVRLCVRMYRYVELAKITKVKSPRREAEKPL